MCGGLEEQRGEHHSPGTVIKSGKAFERCVCPSPSTGGGVLLGRGRKGGGIALNAYTSGKLTQEVPRTHGNGMCDAWSSES